MLEIGLNECFECNQGDNPGPNHGHPGGGRLFKSGKFRFSGKRLGPSLLNNLFEAYFSSKRIPTGIVVNSDNRSGIIAGTISHFKLTRIFVRYI